MNKKLTYEYVDNKGSNRKLRVHFVITPYRSGDEFNPPENGDIEIYSITERGVEIEVSETEIIEIDEFIRKNNEDEYNRYEDYDF